MVRVCGGGVSASSPLSVTSELGCRWHVQETVRLCMHEVLRQRMHEAFRLCAWQGGRDSSAHRAIQCHI